MNFIFKKAIDFLKRLIQPRINIIGLEINDIIIRVAQFQEGNLRKETVVLEPDVIENGKIKNKPLFIADLKKLHAQFSGGKKEKIPVIASIPSANVYVQLFNIPFVSGKNFEEAVRLNLESISPIDIKSSYVDAQQIGAQEKEGKMEIIGAFALRNIIDEYISALEESGFTPVAVEFPALAISRLIKEFGVGIDLEKPQVVLNVASDGINFMVIKHGNLYFDYFVPWRLLQEDGRTAREIVFEDFKQTIIRELRKVSTFYRGHWEGSLDQLILITQALNSEITGIIKENFNFQVIELKVREFMDLPTSWFVTLGSALRGKIPRFEDDLISLMPVGTEKAYSESQILSFVKLWRNVITATLGFLFLLFIFVDNFFVNSSANLDQQLKEFLKIPEGGEVVNLQKQASAFNEFMNKALIAKDKSRFWSPLFIKLNSLAKGDIAFTRISLDASQFIVLITANAKSEASAIEFKNSLIESGFKDVTLPLAGIETSLKGVVSFTVNFKVPPDLY